MEHFDNSVTEKPAATVASGTPTGMVA